MSSYQLLFIVCLLSSLIVLISLLYTVCLISFVQSFSSQQQMSCKTTLIYCKNHHTYFPSGLLSSQVQILTYPFKTCRYSLSAITDQSQASLSHAIQSDIISGSLVWQVQWEINVSESLLNTTSRLIVVLAAHVVVAAGAV